MDRSVSAAFRTESAFELPLGYVDESGVRHRRGVMRLATAADEILPMRDPRVQANPAYLSIIILARVVTKLGSLPEVHAGVIEGLFSEDLAFLQDLYNRVNGLSPPVLAATCPHCGSEHDVEVPPVGG